MVINEKEEAKKSLIDLDNLKEESKLPSSDWVSDDDSSKSDSSCTV